MAASSSSEPLRTDEYRVEEVCPEGRYVRYDKIIARSGTRTVYMGFDRFDGKEIAWCKTTELSDEFNRIASLSILDTCQDDNVLKFYHSWTPDDSPETRNTITELFTSGNLREYISKHILDESDTAIKKWCRQILSALHHLHTNPDRPVIHGDVKIENIFVNGSLGRVKFGYFGFVLQLEDGIPETLSPDILNEADYDEKVDIFSFGMTLLQILSKEVLYSECENSGLVFDKIKKVEPPAALYGVKDSKIRQFIDKCLRHKSERPATIDLMNDPFLADDDVPVTSTAGISVAIVQTFRETVRDQVARLQEKESSDTFGSQGVNNSDSRIVESDSSRRYVRYGETIGEGKTILDLGGRYSRVNKIIAVDGSSSFDSFDTGGTYVWFNGQSKCSTQKVYKGFDNVAGMEIAWTKTELTENLLQNNEILEMLCAEGGLMKLLDHENIVKCYDSWIDYDAKTINMITENFPAGNLLQYLRNHKISGHNAIQNWTRQILNGIAYLHSQTPRIVHRDIICENIFVNGETGDVKIGGFGFALILEQGICNHQTDVGSRHKPSDLVKLRFSELIDIYSFGMCVLEMVWANKCSTSTTMKLPKQVYLGGLDHVELRKMVDDDDEVSRFASRCINQRPSANELLIDPFVALAPPSDADQSQQKPSVVKLAKILFFCSICWLFLVCLSFVNGIKF